ncbi:MAG: nucleotide exchange factor GrpE [Desulforegulaceae bacterium]|nr:nucleotide exchange factor GrpE [Desulforegulaceae bacterium]
MEENNKTSRKIDIDDGSEDSFEKAEPEEKINLDSCFESHDAEKENQEFESGLEEKEADSIEQPDEIVLLKKRLEEAEEKSRESNDKYIRAHAELENFKKRTNREVNEFKKYAVEAIVKQLLPVIDNLERAVLSAESSGETESSQITQGIKMTLKEVERVFDQFSIKSVDAQGEKFDPLYHMAVGQEERDDVEANIVVKQFQKGYLLHERLIRPAMVIVSTGKSMERADNENLDKENNSGE